MQQDQTCPDPDRKALPDLWLLSDARNDAVLEDALAKLPRGSGFIYRHYHLGGPERRKRYAALAEVARKHSHLVILSDSPVKAKQWKADGVYGASQRMPTDDRLLKLIAAHDWKEIVAADRAGADAILLSPVFATRSHAEAKPLGSLRFRMLANKAKAPIIALGGMTRQNAQRLNWPRWAAIDGLS
ncbi:thiamine phosphate synthase [Pontixanthobacter sp. CEM42]|uniref:thiamine phosphate synthase n=1 Tax=Pontixanthobacter sp. CEM42 TaxID=2792077 RepID=UPI001AE06E78